MPERCCSASPLHVLRCLAGKLGLLEVFVHWVSIISKNNQLDDFRMSFNDQSATQSEYCECRTSNPEELTYKMHKL